MRHGVQKIAFGSFGLKALDMGWITSRQIEAARVAMTRYMKRDGKSWIRIFPDKPVTKKPAETRMGSGKGAPEFWVAPVKPGCIMFEIDGVPKSDRRRSIPTGSRKATYQNENLWCAPIMRKLQLQRSN